MKKEKQYVLCINNNECEDLEVRKLYQIIDDPKAMEDGYLRVIDETGEDYLYPENYFILIDLPSAVHKVFEHSTVL